MIGLAADAAGSRPRRGPGPHSPAVSAGLRAEDGLEFVEKLLTTKLESADMTERNASMLAIRPVPS